MMFVLDITLLFWTDYNANLIANEKSKLRIEYLTEENVLYELHNLEVDK